MSAMAPQAEAIARKFVGLGGHIISFRVARSVAL